ncbi:MAG: DsbA family protein [Hyphomicrobiaceae bacterium]|nr:DsbA family protein [Hyphomicrobiaceae bacterium]
MTTRSLLAGLVLAAAAVVPALVGLASLKGEPEPMVIEEAPAEPAVSELRALLEADPEGAVALVRQALLTDPNILEEAITALETQRAEAQAAAVGDVIAANQAAIFESEHNIVLANPEGTITLVEFFDYNCGFCRRALEDLDALAEAHPELRIVVKEFPVLGQDSVDAARVSLAFAMQEGLDYAFFHNELLGNRERANGEEALALAELLGADMDRLREDMTSPAIEAAIRESYELANALGINGTPSFVVGDQLIFGAVGFDALVAAVASAAGS